MSSLEDLPTDLLFNQLKLIRPSDYIRLSIASSRINTFLAEPEIRYRLLKYWSKDDRSIEFLMQYVPKLTLKQLEYVADYYYPVALTKGHNKFDLMNNSLLNGDTSLVEYVPGTYSPEVSVYVQGYVAAELGVHGPFTSAIESLSYSPTLTAILSHRLGSVKMYLDILYKIWEKRSSSPESEPYLIIMDVINNIAKGTAHVIEYRPTREASMVHEILNESQLPEVVEFLQRVGVTYEFERDVDGTIIDAAKSIGNNDVIGAIYHTGIIDKVSEYVKGSKQYIRIRISLSQFDSKKYPTYNLMHDIESGHYVDALHKVNTVDRNVTLTYKYGHYTSWVSSPYESNEFINSTYMSAAAQTAGQLLLSVHPAIAQVCYELDSLSVENTPDNYYTLLQRWCPELEGLSLKHVNVPLILSNYYEPTLVLGDWQGDISVLIDRHLELGAPDERIRRFLYNLRQTRKRIDTSHLDLVNAYLLLYAYDRPKLIGSLRFVTQDVTDMLLYSDPERRKLASVLLGEDIKMEFSDGVLHMIINHTELSADQKLQILSRGNRLMGDLLDGISGLVYNSPLCLAGNIFNQVASMDAIENILQVFGYQYVGKVKSLVGIEDALQRLSLGSRIDPKFPLGLVWKETNYFRRSDSYTDDLIELVANSNLPDDGTLLLNGFRYRDYLEGVKINGIMQTYFASKYGYTLRSPFGNLPITN